MSAPGVGFKTDLVADLQIYQSVWWRRLAVHLMIRCSRLLELRFRVSGSLLESRITGERLVDRISWHRHDEVSDSSFPSGNDFLAA